jgi:hypothetical protein
MEALARRLEAQVVAHLAVRSALLLSLTTKTGRRVRSATAGYSELPLERGYLTMIVPSMRGWTEHMYL